MPQGDIQTWTTRSLLAWMGDALAQKDIDAPRLTAELLLEAATGQGRMDLYTQADRPATPPERTELRRLVRRVLEGEPVQYVLGEWPFFGMRFKVDHRVLIPRPCTELLCEEVLQSARSRPRGGGEPGEGVLIADVGTGSGCVALAIAQHLPGARVVAGDISQDALDVARVNAQVHGLGGRVVFAQGDGLTACIQHPWLQETGGADYIVSNPPYIPDAEWRNHALVDQAVREHEPEQALRGGENGLLVIGPLVDQAARSLRPGGLLAIETAASTNTSVAERIERTPGLRLIGVRRDLDGHNRVVVATTA